MLDLICSSCLVFQAPLSQRDDMERYCEEGFEASCTHGLDMQHERECAERTLNTATLDDSGMLSLRRKGSIAMLGTGGNTQEGLESEL